jgi:hypothetical protein
MKIDLFQFKNKNEAKGILKTLQAIHERIPSKKYWIQGGEEAEIMKEVEDKFGNYVEERTGEYQYCLIGAEKDANGPHEMRTAEMICLEIATLFPARTSPLDEMYDIEHFVNVMAGKAEVSIEVDFSADAYNIIPAFNDHHETQYKDVIKVIKAAQKRCEAFLAA